MSDKIVRSPEIRDTELPEQQHFNGIDQPYLDAGNFAGNGPWVLKTGDEMSGTLFIHTIDPQAIDDALTDKMVALAVFSELTGSNTALNNLFYGIHVNLANESSSTTQTYIDLQVGVITAS